LSDIAKDYVLADAPVPQSHAEGMTPPSHRGRTPRNGETHLSPLPVENARNSGRGKKTLSQRLLFW
jgi:hypothetical protein